MCIADPFLKNRYLDFSNSADLKLSSALLSFHKKLGPHQNFNSVHQKIPLRKCKGNRG